MRQRLLIFLSLIGVSYCFPTKAQEIAVLEVNLQDTGLTSGIPVSTDLNRITYLPDSLLDFVEEVDGQIKKVNFQIENLENRKLIWMVEPRNTPGKRIFRLHQRKVASLPPLVTANIEDGGIVLGIPGRKLWRYNYATFFPPKGVDEIYKRSGFIHPFWSPSGKELTRIQPPDHYHHYGLWNPWTKVEYKGKTVDFWNLAEGQGTVRFAHLISRVSGRVFGGYQVLHEHVVFEEDGEEVALNEVQGVRLYYEQDRKEVYMADLSILLNCATDNAVTLKEYRYGGLGWRATEKWHKGNSETITSAGKNRVEADGTLARWCILQGELDDGYAAVLIMSFPTNYNHPEPLRIWPEDMYGRGDVFANFSPTKNKDWQLEPGKIYQLNYRFYVSDNKIAVEEAERLWQHYAHPPDVKVTLVK